MDTLIEFRAGRMLYQDRTLRADTRKGLIRVAEDDQGLKHFQWLERDASEPETDIILFPGEAKFDKIDRPGARVFLLKFHQEADRNLFFWAQDPSAEEDGAYAAAIDSAINQEGMEEDVEGEAGTAAAQPAAQQPLAAPAPAAGAGLGGGVIQADMLASVLSNIMGGSGGAAALQQLQQRQRAAALEVGPSLGEVLKPELVVPLLQSPAMLERLAPFLPEQQRSREGMAEVVASPQFRHQLAVFTHALMSGELDLSQFGLPGQGFGVLEFLKAIQRQADAEKSEKSGQQGQPQQPDTTQP